MIKRVIIITMEKFTRRDYQRFGIEILRSNGFEAEVWNLAMVLQPKFTANNIATEEFIFDGLKLIEKATDMDRELSGLSSRDFIIMLPPCEFYSLGVYRALSKSQASYALLSSNAVPSCLAKSGKKESLGLKIRAFCRCGWKGVLQRKLIKVLPYRWYGLKPAKLVLAGGLKSLNSNYLIDENTEVLWVHTMDYDIFLREKDDLSTEQSMAVFLDEYFPLHPDYELLGLERPIGFQRYYDLLNIFFDSVEKKTKHEVVIAAHPRSYYENLPDCFNGRKFVKGETLNLVKKSRIVLGHASTSLNFACLYNKPVIFMTCSELDRAWEGDHIRGFAKSFGKQPVNMENPENIDWANEFKINKTMYDEYRKSYIKTDNSVELPFWQIFADRLKKGF